MEIKKWVHKVPSVPHSLLNDAMNIAVEFYKEHIRRDVADGRVRPAEYWLLLRGYLIAGMQTYAGICILLSNSRPKPLMLQAAVLNRALLENLATVLALTESPGDRTPILLRESTKLLATTFKKYVARFGADPKWQEYLGVFRHNLTTTLKAQGLPIEVLSEPGLITDEWPTPGAMLWGTKKKKLAPFVTGSRHAVLKELYEAHYSHQSAQAHARMAAMSMAMLVDDPDAQWNPGQGESNLVSHALLFLCCILSEIEYAGSYPRHSKLAEVWAYLRDLDDEAKEIWTLRYEALAADASRT
jgi:hypothetical protein